MIDTAKMHCFGIKVLVLCAPKFTVYLWAKANRLINKAMNIYETLAMSCSNPQ